VVVESINAGADALLVCHLPESIVAVHEALVKAVESGAITRPRWAEAEARLARLRR